MQTRCSFTSAIEKSTKTMTEVQEKNHTDPIHLSSRPLGQLMRRAVTYTHQAGADRSNAPLSSKKKLSLFLGPPLCVCVCVYIYIYIYIYMCTHTHTHMHTYIYTYTYKGCSVGNWKSCIKIACKTNIIVCRVCEGGDLELKIDGVGTPAARIGTWETVRQDGGALATVH